ncbi:hypothetical protein K488DRAFT_86337 [Vararia minispora EC-137]|uniref:Uncharacterized protein n=1 Tax=Vararia minispora EC-137 TaxID=1314806 RepID=A0ACB8QJZ2_9AGAM|nr:hypothetical protein K488DRAFT_86337 [Vararia minispora EC-137]
MHSALLLTITQYDPELAFARSKDAVILFEYLQTQHPRKYDASLSTALTNHSNSLCGLGEYSQALQTIKQSVHIQRDLLFHHSRPRVTSSLCCALHNLAQCLLDAGDSYSTQLALGTITEAIELIEVLTRDNPAFLHVLGTCLLTYSHCHVRHGDHAEGVRAAERAIRIRRTCTMANSAQRDALLAEAYSHLSSCYSIPANGDTTKALSAIQGAVSLQRGLLREDRSSTKILDALAYYLYRSAMLLARIGGTDEAIRAIEESVAHREQLALGDPSAYNADLSQSLHDLGVLLHNNRQHAGAKSAMQKALRIRGKLAMMDGQRYGRSLRNSEEALTVIQSACLRL